MCVRCGVGCGDGTKQGLESANTPHWQSFDISAECGDQYVTMINIVMKGTGSGADGWSVLDARIIGTPIENPSDVYNVSFWKGGG